MKPLNGDLIIEGTIQADAAPRAWTDPDDAPELTEEWFAKAVVHENGQPVRSRDGSND